MVRLHLGCGKRLFPGFVNIDGFDDRADLKADIRNLPFPDNHADLIAAIHVFEHFAKWEAVPLATEWYRVLKPEGVLIMEMPSLDKILALFATGTNEDFNTAYLGLYGDWSTERDEMIHKWTYSEGQIMKVLQIAGFRMASIHEPEFHVKRRDMRVVAIK